MRKIETKTKEELKVMVEGGRRLGAIKKALLRQIKPGVSAAFVDSMADRLIKKEQGQASFKMVPGYSWATCINVNEGVVHGIPKPEISFRENDLVSVDVGFYYQGFHTDTSFSVALGKSLKLKGFLEIGRIALKQGIDRALTGNRVYDISKAIEMTLTQSDVFPVRALVGHGIGRKLHEEPQVPCFTKGKREQSPLLSEGVTLAIEVMYTEAKSDLELTKDGWTIVTSDAKIAGLFEETVAITESGPLVLTKLP